MTHVRFGRSHLHPMGQLTHTRHSDGDPDPDGSLKDTIRIKIRHYHNVDHRETSVLVNELPEESDHFRFLRALCFANLKGTVGLIMAKTSAIRISIPLDHSSRSFIPLPRFIRSCRLTPFLAPSLLLFPPRSD